METKREVVELVDGRVYWSDDHWETVWRTRRGRKVAPNFLLGKPVTDKEEADFARFLAVMQQGPGS